MMTTIVIKENAPYISLPEQHLLNALLDKDRVCTCTILLLTDELRHRMRHLKIQAGQIDQRERRPIERLQGLEQTENEAAMFLGISSSHQSRVLLREIATSRCTKSVLLQLHASHRIAVIGFFTKGVTVLRVHPVELAETASKGRHEQYVHKKHVDDVMDNATQWYSKRSQMRIHGKDVDEPQHGKDVGRGEERFRY